MATTLAIAANTGQLHSRLHIDLSDVAFDLVDKDSTILTTRLDRIKLDFEAEPEKAQLKVKLRLADGPIITGDATYDHTGELAANVAIIDERSNAIISFDRDQNRIKARFNGNLHHETVNIIFPEKQLTDGRIDGDLTVIFAPDKSPGGTTSGTLKGSDINLPLGLKEPLLIPVFVVAGQEEVLAIEQLDFSLGKVQAEVDGTIASAEDNIHFDLNLHSGPLDILNMIETFTPKPAEAKPEKNTANPSDKNSPFWAAPLTGRINLNVKSLKLDYLRITPLRASIQLTPMKLDAKIKEASLCDIDLLAVAEITPGVINLKLPLSTLDQDMYNSSACLSDSKSTITGHYDLVGSFKTQGAADELIDNAQGNFTLNARDGEVEQSPLITRLLKVVNLAEFYRTDFSTKEKDRLKYKTLTTEGHLAKGQLKLAKILFDGPTLDLIGEGRVKLFPVDLDVVIMVAPLKTVDSVIKWLPGINYLFGGNLVTIPVRISGPASDINVSVVPVKSVGKGLLGFTERVLKLPARTLDPILKGEQDKQ